VQEAVFLPDAEAAVVASVNDAPKIRDVVAHE
jgi:hypothetical protein